MPVVVFCKKMTKGLIYYTIGERHGFEVTKKGTSSGPFYIVAKDFEKNTLIVSDQESEIIKMSPKRIALTNVNWVHEPKGKVIAQIRYKGEKLPVIVKNNEVVFTQPVRGLSLGQSIVFYSSDKLLGGAVMDKIIS